MNNRQTTKINCPVSARRRRYQRGVEAIEFGLFAVVMAPAMIWMFTTGMNFLRFNKANDVTRAAALMYVKGTNMMVLGSQELVERIGEGLDLRVDDGATPPNQTLKNDRGSGVIILTQVQYVGSATCPTGCTNYGKYVFMHRAYIGNRNLVLGGGDDSDTKNATSALGDPSNSAWNSTTGVIADPHGNSGAAVDASFANIWPTNGGVGDGQIAYVIEAYFKGSFGSGQFNGRGIYTRILM